MGMVMGDFRKGRAVSPRNRKGRTDNSTCTVGVPLVLSVLLTQVFLLGAFLYCGAFLCPGEPAIY